MEALPPIPTPLHQRWREFRIQVLPVIVFLITAVTIVYMWRTYVHSSDVVGAVQTNTVSITTTTEGRLADLLVDEFDTVAKGQPIGQIIPFDPEVTAAALAAIAAEFKMQQARMDLDKFRNQDSLLRMRLSLLTEQVGLDLAQIHFKQARSELQRAQSLREQQLIGDGLPLIGNASRFDFGLDVARRDYDMLQAEINSRSNTVAQLQKETELMASSPMVKLQTADPVIEEVIRSKQEELRLLNQAVILKSPIDGIVSAIYKRPGEKLIRGNVIATISALKSDRIIGYLRQPIEMLPTTNDTVLVSTRAHRRQVGKGQIIRIGVQLEHINPLLLSPDASKIEMGLPFLVSLPDNMRLIPGEFVDLSIRYDTARQK
jgi:multidrug resistance efflux pump